jgi:lysophospholipid acyltransferase (LPLAT)-like uncharacterized protein
MEAPHADARARWVGLIGSRVIGALGRTWRTRVIGAEHVDACRASGKGFIYAFWHGMLLPLAYLKRGEGAIVLVSLHRDGEYITQVIHRQGYGTVRGSTSRGGFRSLVEMARLGRQGKALGFTPDGPRGPRHRAQPGVLLCAQRAAVPIVPTAASAYPRKLLSSWDRFMIPAPFARVVLVFGEPWYVPEGLTGDALIAQGAPQLEAALMAVTERSEREVCAWAGASPDLATFGAPPAPST